MRDRSGKQYTWLFTRAAALVVMCIFSPVSGAETPATPPSPPPPSANDRPAAPAFKAAPPAAPKPPDAVAAPRAAPLAAPAAAPDPADARRLQDLAARLAVQPAPTPQEPASAATSKGGGAAAPAPAHQPSAIPGGVTEQAAAQSNQATLAPAERPRPLGPRAAAGTELAADTAGDARPGTSWVLSTLTALGVVLLAIFACRGMMRRWFGAAAIAGATPVVQVLTRTSVAPRNHVLLLRVGGRILVVGDSAAGLRTLASIDDDQEVAELLTAISASKPTSVTGGFRQLLANFNRAYRRPQVGAEEGTDDKEFAVDRARDEVSSLLGKVRGITPGGGS